MSPSWEEFVARHVRAVLDSALRVVAHASDAEDVAQEVFLEVWRGGKMGDLFDQPALLRTMATRRGLDLLRKKRRTAPLEGHEVDGRGHEPSQYAVARELDLRLRDQLAKLAAREAEVFCLTYFEQMPAEEIANMLGISRGALAKSLSTARRKLSAAFEKHRTDV